MMVIGNPDNRRTEDMQQARRRCGLKPAIVLPYARLLQTWRSGGSLADAAGQEWREPRGDGPVLVRLDAPGEDWTVERELIALGAAEGLGQEKDSNRDSAGSMFIAAEDALSMEYVWGRIYAPRQWFRGWKACLQRLDEEMRELWPSARFLNEPKDIAIMFDKRKCQRHLGDHGISVPPVLPQSEHVRSYAGLRAAMLDSGMHRVFVKLASGSGASGVVAYQLNPRTGAEIAVTTVGMERSAGETFFYNEGRLRRYTSGEDIETLLDWLCAEGTRIERWMPKATLEGRSYDVRQLVAGGLAGHAIVRLSRTPITNLHLRNERMLPKAAGLSEARMERVRTAAMATMSAFPNSWSAGIDVMLSGSEPRAYVLDVNPFGDLLYRVEWNGLGTYEWEMELLRKEPLHQCLI